MNDQNHTLQKLHQKLQDALGTQLAATDFEVVEIVPIPKQGDRMVKLRTLEEILDELDRSENPNTLGYFLHVKPKAQTNSQAAPKTHESNTYCKPSDAIYTHDGKLNISYLFKNAEILFNSGDYILARNIYKAIMQSGERTSVALFGVARCYEAEGKIKEAQANYEESIAYHPTFEAYQRLSALYLDQSKDQIAAETLERAINLKNISSATKFEIHKACGNCWIRAHNAHKAEKHYQKALEINPNSDEIHSNIGALFLQTAKSGQTEKLSDAKKHFQSALALNSKNHQALSGLATCYFTEGDKRSAHDSFAKSLEIELNNPSGIFFLVKCAYEIRSYATATRILEEYIQIAPINANLLYSLAGLQYHLGRMKEAKSTIQKILKLKGDHKGALELQTLIDRYAVSPQL